MRSEANSEPSAIGLKIRSRLRLLLKHGHVDTGAQPCWFPRQGTLHYETWAVETWAVRAAIGLEAGVLR